MASLKASTYLLTKSMKLRRNSNDVLVKGNNSQDVIRLTFKEGETITDYANLIAANTSITSEEFIDATRDIILTYYFDK